MKGASFYVFCGQPEKGLFGSEDDYDDQYMDDGPQMVNNNSGLGVAGDEGEGAAPKRNGKVVNIHATTQLKVVLVKPEHFEDASTIADHLNNKRTVVLNLESTNKEVSRRLVDFLSGVAYANNGQIKRVANSTFIITPLQCRHHGRPAGRAGEQWRVLLIPSKVPCGASSRRRTMRNASSCVMSRTWPAPLLAGALPVIRRF